MPDEILAKDVDAETRRKTAVLLEQKLKLPFQTLDDVIGMLQLILVADENAHENIIRDPYTYASRSVGGRAGRRVHEALHRILHGLPAGDPSPFGSYGLGPANVIPKGMIYRWQFYEVHQATLPLLSSRMAHHKDRERITLSAIQMLRKHESLLRIMFIHISQIHLRRIRLGKYMRAQSVNPNRGQILVNIIAFAADQVTGTAAPANMMMGDLFAVVIGRDMLGGRLQGQYMGPNIKGAAGFKPEYRDRHNQIQHAVAGLVLGDRIGVVGTSCAAFLEWCGDEPQDVALYWASYRASRNLSDENYRGLSAAVRREICDNTVKPAP